MVPDEVRRLNHGRETSFGWAGVIIVLWPSVHPGYGLCPAPTASGEDASCTISNVCMTQGKGIIWDHKCAAHREREVQIQGPRHCISYTHLGV